MAKIKEDIARLFGGKDNEPITEELIKELVLTGEFEEKDLRWFQEEGYTYCRPSNRFPRQKWWFPRQKWWFRLLCVDKI